MLDVFKLGLCNKFFPESTVHVMIGFIAVLTIGYLLGSLNFGVIISKVFYNDDVRKHGSGNAGMTNMLRTYGKLPAALTFLGDGAKTAVAVFVGALFLGVYNNVFYTYDGAVYANFEKLITGLAGIYGENVPAEIPGVVSYVGFAGMYIGGMASMIGHAFPFYYKFKGGKSVVAAAILVLCTEPLIFLILMAMFICIVAVTKYISLGSIMCVIMYPLLLNRMTGPGPHNLVAIFVMLFVVYLHRGNIKKLLNGQENKSSFKKKDSGEESK